ncbi:Maf-like protein [Nitratireductor aestuarii]|uniref:7-methyl-GTP pyrophosphatase n=1 Tax=Nitratireductor aestuarii TaxID=1735103 RepID=A0A916RGU6_9HYPH|nr:Maf-like protein [Nitratireductor aestuarii]GGA57137.1 Maf-like protein [Nitratireductor aestuarii]
MEAETIILASTSPFRRQLLENAGLKVEPVAPEVDERAVEEALEGSDVNAEDVAQILAEAKAVEVSERYPGRWIIGGDQTLSLGDEVFHKPKDMEGARRHLLALSGKTHQLNSGVVLARNGETVWRHVSIARMTMRPLDPAFIGRHLARVGDIALKSVGAYQVEGEGIQLFEKIDGDYFTIVGLPLLPLLAKLRELKVIDA